MAGETFLGKLMMACGRAVEGRLWGGGTGNYLHPLEDASESSK